MDQETAAKPKMSLDSCRKFLMVVRDFPPGCGSGAKPMVAAVGSQKPTMDAFEKQSMVVRDFPPGFGSGAKLQPAQDCPAQKPAMNAFESRPMVAGQSSRLVKKMVPKMDGPRKTQSIATLSQGPEMARRSHGGGITARDRVEECLRLLRDIYKRIDEEQKKPGKEVITRVDLHAYKQLRDEGKLVNQNQKIPGSVDGVNIGDTFYYQSELYAVGVHRQLMKGIDSILYMGQMVAASIVASRSGSDDMSNPNVLVYCGEGGTSRHKDQQLRGGNLALKNSISTKTPVRVTRKVGATRRDVELVRSTHEVFIYDGLYRVVKLEEEDSRTGYKVYKFTLMRDEDQPPIRRH